MFLVGGALLAFAVPVRFPCAQTVVPKFVNGQGGNHVCLRVKEVLWGGDDVFFDEVFHVAAVDLHQPDVLGAVSVLAVS